MNLDNLRRELRQLARVDKAETLPRFFKTGPGEYGEGDQFLGVVAPDIRKVAKIYGELSLKDIEKLLHSPWHEERMCALMILIEKYQKTPTLRKKLYKVYLDNATYINNWDLVDLSAAQIVGAHIYAYRELISKLYELAESDLLWERRISVISTFYFIKQGEAEPCLTIAEKLLDDQHDLIHKAVGWMLREAWKRADQAAVENFIKFYYDRMPRTTLRYAIERFPEDKRRRFLNGHLT